MFSQLNLYIVRLWLPAFVGILLLVSALFFIQSLIKFLPSLLQHGAPFELILTLFASVIPFQLTMIIPIAYFFALVRLVGELQSNSEIDAMYASGLSVINIFSSIFYLGLLLTAFMLYLTMELTPASRMLTQNTIFKLASLKGEPEFQPQKFMTDIQGIVFYFEGKGADGAYMKVMLTDSRQTPQTPTIYLAKRATIKHTETGLHIQFFNGTQLSGEKTQFRVTSFSHYNLMLPEQLARDHQISSSASPIYMDTATLLHALDKNNASASDVAQWHFRWVTSLSVLLLFLFAVPLSMQVKRAKTSSVFLVALTIMVAINQAELILFRKIAMDLLPWWSLWAAFTCFFLLGGYLFYLVHNYGIMRIRWRKNFA